MADRHFVDVHILFVHAGRLLLLRRRDADPEFDGKWHLPSGKLDAGESVLDAAAREADEEAGVLVRSAELRLVHAAHVTGPGRESRIGLFFAAETWRGEPINREPEKCSAVRWFDLHDLPDGLIPYSATGIRGYQQSIPLSTLGWPNI